jgi:hypothetical protein
MPSTATASSFRLRLHYKAARVGGVRKPNRIIMDHLKKNLFYEFGQKVTMREPQVSVLNSEIYDQYILTVKAIDSCLKNKLESKKLLLPELRTYGNETIAIYSDYGGESSDSKFFTYSFLVCGWNHSFAFQEFMNDLRAKYKLNDKEISFKDIGYGPVDSHNILTQTL